MSAPAPSALVGTPVVDITPAGSGQELRIVCSRCKGVNSSRMQYCQYCGAPLHEPASQVPAVSAAGPSAGAAPVPARLEPAESPQPRLVEAARSPARMDQPAAARTDQERVRPTPGQSTARPSTHTSPRARLVVIAQDGTPGRDYLLAEAQTDIGRVEGSILLPNDPYVSPRHARVYYKNSRFFVQDLGSVNGVYVRLTRPETLRNADLVLIGLEVLRFELVSDTEKGLGPAAEQGTQVFGSPAAARYARLCQRTVEGVTRDVHHLTRDETVLGREVGDVVFTSDPFMSRRHAIITRDRQNDSFVIRDLGSSNGTYLAVRGEHAMDTGDHLRIGQHLFRLEVD